MARLVKGNNPNQRLLVKKLKKLQLLKRKNRAPENKHQLRKRLHRNLNHLKSNLSLNMKRLKRLNRSKRYNLLSLYNKKLRQSLKRRVKKRKLKKKKLK